MNQNVSSQKGRWILMIVILGSFIASFLILFIVGRHGRIAAEGIYATIKELIGIYLPLIAMMTAFYFGQQRAGLQTNSTTIETFVFSVLTVSAWVLIPPIFILFGGAIESIFDTINLLKPYGDTVAAAGVAFYFARTM